MPKTYGTVTTFTAGSVLTAAQLNVASTAVNNLVVPAAVRLDKNATQTLTTATAAALTWPAATYDTDSMYSGSNTTRITANTAGIYIITATVCFAANATGERYAFIAKNGSTATSYGETRLQAGPATGGSSVTVAAMLSLAQSEYIEIYAYQTSGGNLNVTSGAAAPTSVSATWIGRTS